MGYYVNNAYSDEFPDLVENPPAQPDIQKLTRHILVEKPRVTKFLIKWEEEEQQNVGITPSLVEQQMSQTELMPDGAQAHVRNDMMSNANLANAAQTFNQN